MCPRLMARSRQSPAPTAHTASPASSAAPPPEYAAVNYLNQELSPHDFISLRSDYLDDKKGQRTGYATRYSENT